MNVYISHNYRDFASAGNQAKSDMETLMQRMGFRNIGLRQSVCRSKVIHFVRNFIGVARAKAALCRGDVLFLQYPLKKYFTSVCRTARRKGARTVVLVHDLGSCRRKAISPSEEVRRLNCADYIIATNSVMAGHLRSMGVTSMIDSLDMWDNLTSGKDAPEPLLTGPTVVAYAGTLSPRKSAFLSSWGRVVDNYRVEVYGSGFDASAVAFPEKFTDNCFVAAPDLIAGMRGDYGLVWDGDSLDTCSGNFGEYLSLNTPHKISLYIRAGLPVAIWSGAAMAGFVRERGVGVVIDRLSDLNTALPQRDSEAYRSMLANVHKLAEQVSRGHFFCSACARALDALR